MQPSKKDSNVAAMLGYRHLRIRKQATAPAQSELILKLAHGRVSKTKDGAIQLTLKVYQDEGINIPHAIAREAKEACKAVKEWLLKGKKAD